MNKEETKYTEFKEILHKQDYDKGWNEALQEVWNKTRPSDRTPRLKEVLEALRRKTDGN